MHIQFCNKTLSLLCIMVCFGIAYAQEPESVTANNKAGSQPFGVYSGDGPDRVNLSNGNLTVNIPLVELPGRAGLNLAMVASFNSKLWIDRTVQMSGHPDTFKVAEPNPEYRRYWNPVDGYTRIGWIVRQTPGDYRTQTRYMLYNKDGQNCVLISGSITTSDGAVHETRNVYTDFAPIDPTQKSHLYRTIDGSHLTYNSITDKIMNPGGASGTVDVHGNFISTRAGTINLAANMSEFITTDTGGRELRYWCVGGTQSGYGPDKDYVTQIDINPNRPGAKSIKLYYQALHVWTECFEDPETPDTARQGYHGNTIVLKAISLPNGRSYEFEYDQRPHAHYDYFGRIDPGHPTTSSLLRLAKITYPTGGYTRYEYENINRFDDNTVLSPVVTRRILCDGPGQAERIYQYQYTAHPNNHLADRLDQRWYTTVIRPDGTRELHTFDVEGYNLSTDIYQGNDRLLRTETSYAFQMPSGPGLSWGDMAVTRQNVRPDYVRTILQNGAVSQTNYAYDTEGFEVGGTQHTTGNVVQKAEYDYGPGYPGSLIRLTARGYLHEAIPQYGVYAKHILNRLTWEQVYEQTSKGFFLRAWTGHEYDVTGYLENRQGAWQHDDYNFASWNTLRGNRVRSYRYLINNGVPANDPITENLTWYDTLGNVVKTQDALERQTQYSYADNYSDGVNRNGWVHPTQITPPAAQSGATPETVTRRYYFENGLLERETDPRGQSVVMYYDLMNRPTRIVRPDNGSTQTNYNDATRTVDVYEQLDATQSMHSQQIFDGLGRLILKRLFNPVEGNSLVEQQYDILGRLWKVSNPYFEGSTATRLWTTTSYDALDRITSIQTPDGAVAQSIYQSQQTLSIDPAGKQRRSEHDAAGRLIKVWEDPNTKNYLTTYRYDVSDNLVQVEQGGQLRTFEYDSLSRLVAETHPEAGPSGSGGTTRYTYYNNGLLSQKTDPRGAITTHSYDNLNRLVSKTYSGIATPSVVFNYGLSSSEGNQFGRLKSSSAGGTTNAYTYDIMGRVLEKIVSFASVPDTTFRVGYRYDLAGQVTEVQYPSGRAVGQSWDSSGYLRSVNSTRVPSGYYMNTMRYAPHGAMATAGYGNSLSLNATFNSRLQTSGLTIPGRMSLEYRYDWFEGNNGNVHRIYDALTGKEYLYQYDALNRIQRASGTGHPVAQDYSYDRWGNLVKSVVDESQIGSYYEQSKNRKTGSALTYDNAGNQLADGQRQYTYDAENRIATVNGGASAYEYDAEGRRVRRTVNGATTYYVYGTGADVLSEFVVDRGLTTSQTQAPQSDPVVNYMHTDHLGTPRVITDQSGAVVSRHDYYPFGEEITSPAFADGQTHKFTGKERDPESGLDYFGARYLSSAQGRFTSLDPTLMSANPVNPQSWNRYAYVLNNPLRKIDPDGRYNRDVHQDLTIALAYAAGFSVTDAREIGFADQAIDDKYSASDKDNRVNYHFTTAERRAQLWEIFVTEGTFSALGTFTHADKDSFSHAGYGPVLGHSTSLAVDYTYTDPEKADEMAKSSLAALVKARSIVRNRDKSTDTAKAVPWDELQPYVSTFNRATTPEAKKQALESMNSFVRTYRKNNSTNQSQIVPPNMP